VLYRDGHYEILRVTENGTETLQGTLSQDEITRLNRSLETLNSESNSRGVIRQGLEPFIAEILRGDETIRFVWIDPDHDRRFPNRVVKIVNWLQSFKAAGAFPLTLHELSDRPICPRAAQPFRP